MSTKTKDCTAVQRTKKIIEPRNMAQCFAQFYAKLMTFPEFWKVDLTKSVRRNARRRNASDDSNNFETRPDLDALTRQEALTKALRLVFEHRGGGFITAYALGFKLPPQLLDDNYLYSHKVRRAFYAAYNKKLVESAAMRALGIKKGTAQ